MKKNVLSYYLLLTLFSATVLGQSYPYQNSNLPVEERVNDLVERMTLEEKIGQMVNSAPAIDRLGIPSYDWWNECLHGVGRAGKATVFPQAIGMAATFDRNAMHKTAQIISDEARAKYHHALSANKKAIPQYYGLTFWTPNINIFRDPRWGRGQETYGEDPFLTGEMGVAFVKGLQGNDKTYFKTIATAKHYAVHSGPEYNRHTFDSRTDLYDLWDTYLPAFEKLIKSGDVYSVMCAYNRFEGEPCCGSDELLVDILRNKWKFEGYVVSDCGAIDDFYKEHKTSKDAAEASSQAVLAGTDLECGRSYDALIEAVKRGEISEYQIDVAVKRLFIARMRLGMFDPDDKVIYSKIPYSVVCSPESRKQALEMAEKSIVLLKNNAQTLPLKKTVKTIAVLGPNADNPTCLLGNYNGSPSYIVTPLDGIRKKAGNKIKVIYDQATGLTDKTISEPVDISGMLKSNGQSGYKMDFFENNDFEGNPLTTRFVKEVDFFKSKQLPAGLKPGKVGIRWTATYTSRNNETLYLEITSDDSFSRLFINGEKVKSCITYQETRTELYPFEVKAGEKYDLRFETYPNNAGGGACMKTATRRESNPEVLKEKIKSADVIVFVGGISPSLEGEEMPVFVEGFNKGDRTTINLPAVQTEMLKSLKETGKPIIFVLCTGSALAIDWENRNLPAILNTWYGGQDAGTALADVLFGDCNPSGRLPITFYTSDKDLPPYEDYSMKGRTYRYFTGKPLYEFGYGLSYSRFEYSDLQAPDGINIGDSVKVSVKVTNKSKIKGEEVVQLYLSHPDSKTETPIRSLQGFQRVAIQPGETREVEFTLLPENFSVIDALAQRSIIPGKLMLSVGGCQPGKEALQNQQALQKECMLKGRKWVLSKAY